MSVSKHLLFPVLYSVTHASHDGKADEADLLHNAEAKVIAERLADLDSVADAKLRDLTWLDCTASQATHHAPCILPEAIILGLSKMSR